MDTILLSPQGNLLNYSYTEIVINMVAAFVIGVLLSVTYRTTHKGLSYSQSVRYTHLRAHVTKAHLVCRLLLEKKATKQKRRLKRL